VTLEHFDVFKVIFFFVNEIFLFMKDRDKTSGEEDERDFLEELSFLFNWWCQIFKHSQDQDLSDIQLHCLKRPQFQVLLLLLLFVYKMDTPINFNYGKVFKLFLKKLDLMHWKLSKIKADLRKKEKIHKLYLNSQIITIS
jgi:hypothetical protein